MELYPFIESGSPLLLSASENGLFLHPVRNERFGHPFLLCSGYKDGFSGCIYNDALYYTYINKENSLLLRRLHESTLLFRLDSTDTITYRAPQLVTFRDTLFLFYTEILPDSFRLRLRLPFSEVSPQLPDPLRSSFFQLPLLSLHSTETHLYLFLYKENTTVSYRYSKEKGFESLYNEEDFLSDLQIPWAEEKVQLEQALLRAVHLSEQQQNQLAEKTQKLQTMEAKLAKLISDAELAEQKAQQTALLLDRAKAQYNELMQVAEQYRQEAMKWYGKFTERT